jgi:hypothetical protein
MILIGDEHIPYDTLYKVQNIDMIKTTPSNSVLLFDFDIELMKYCMQNDLNYSVVIQNITQAIYANNLNAKYIITNENISKSIQDIAQNYMFDCRVLAIIENSNDLEKIALDGIDGAIYKSIL